MTAGNIENYLMHFLFQYRIMSHTTTGRSPAESLMVRRSWTFLDQIRSSVRVSTKQKSQKKEHDQGTVQRTFIMADAVRVHNFTQGPH